MRNSSKSGGPPLRYVLPIDTWPGTSLTSCPAAESSRPTARCFGTFLLPLPPFPSQGPFRELVGMFSDLVDGWTMQLCPWPYTDTILWIIRPGVQRLARDSYRKEKQSLHASGSLYWFTSPYPLEAGVNVSPFQTCYRNQSKLRHLRSFGVQRPRSLSYLGELAWAGEELCRYSGSVLWSSDRRNCM